MFEPGRRGSKRRRGCSRCLSAIVFYLGHAAVSDDVRLAFKRPRQAVSSCRENGGARVRGSQNGTSDSGRWRAASSAERRAKPPIQSDPTLASIVASSGRFFFECAQGSDIRRHKCSLKSFTSSNSFFSLRLP
jgi:hypothetical protein